GLVNAVLEVKRSDFVDDDDDDGAYLVDLIGLPVFDVKGTALGTIAAFSDNVAQVLAEVKTAGGQIVLVPFVPPIVDSIEDDRIVLAPPAGLFDDDALEAGDANSADQQAAELDGDEDDEADDVDGDDEAVESDKS
ncbi:MAG TPA: PRC-barrel domain-containing protein, partial [Myxococcota bacterium]